MKHGTTIEDTMKEQYTVVTRKGQITVPAEIRKALGLQIGDRVAVSIDENGQPVHANLRPVHSVADATFGSIQSQQPVTEEEVRQAFAEHATARDERTKRS
jgi:AbrB family looped-hinge helix DNA binding protein